MWFEQRITNYRTTRVYLSGALDQQFVNHYNNIFNVQIKITKY